MKRVTGFENESRVAWASEDESWQRSKPFHDALRSIHMSGLSPSDQSKPIWSEIYFFNSGKNLLVSLVTHSASTLLALGRVNDLPFDPFRLLLAGAQVLPIGMVLGVVFAAGGYFYADSCFTSTYSAWGQLMKIEIRDFFRTLELFLADALSGRVS
tara:strand:+ start:1587 stop:2054 length:468 start_codon:yes stop_codon:yes gene_type:complete